MSYQFLRFQKVHLNRPELDKRALENLTLKIKLYATPTSFRLLFFFWNAVVGLKLGNSTAEVVVSSEKDVNNY